MTTATKTIAFRISQAIEEQIDAVARTEGLSKGEWVRAKVMEILHAATPTNGGEDRGQAIAQESKTTPNPALQSGLPATGAASPQRVIPAPVAADQSIICRQCSDAPQEGLPSAEASSHEMPPATRIYSLAKTLKIDSRELVDICTRAGVTGKGSALASLTDHEVERVRVYLRDHGLSPVASQPATPTVPGGSL
jgi:hypothetical protein